MAGDKKHGSEKRQRTAQHRTRLTPAEKADLDRRAAEAGMDVAAFVRHQIFGTPGPRVRQRQMSAELAELARLRGDLGYIGNNLNQLTRLANMGDLDRPRDLDAVLARITALLDPGAGDHAGRRMIVKGKSRGDGRQLAAYLLADPKNERAELIETRGFEPGDLADQLEGAEALALAETRGTKTLYHTQLRAADGERMTPEQWHEAIEIAERHLGLQGLPRAIVRHVKDGEEHFHAVWSRYDAETGRLRSDSNDALKRKAAAREIEERFDLRRLDQNRTKDRSDTNEAEARQNERAAKPKRDRVAEITALWSATDSGQAFRAALEEAGYTLARGKQRAFCVVDQAGEVHSLARQIRGAKAADLAARMADLDAAALPEADAVRKAIKQAQKDRDQAAGKTRPTRSRKGREADEADDAALEIDPVADIRLRSDEERAADRSAAGAILAELGRTRSTWTRSQMARAAAQATGYTGREAWMQQEGGIDALSPEHRASAERSYEAWAELNPRPAAKYDLADYVSYAQEREAERQAEADPEAQQTATETRAAFRALMAEIKASPELVTVTADEGGRARFTSQSQLAAEMQMEQAAAGLAERTGHAVRQRTRDTARRHTEAAGNIEFSAEQRAAFNHVTGKEDIALVVGYAGAGKSTMLNAARAAWEAEEYRVQGTALSGIAAQGLQDSAGIESRNLHQFLHRLESGEERAEQLAAMDARIAGITGKSSKAQKFRADLTRRRADMAADMERGSLSNRDIIVVDEAAMIGARQMERLLTAAHQAGAKVVLVGDHEQLQAIEAGAAFRALMDRHGAAQMTEIFRQREDWQREATKQFPTGKARQALDAYRDHGMTHEAGTRDEAKAALVQAWQAGRERDPTGTQIILAHLRADVTDLNRLARAAYRTEGRLGEDHELELRDGRMTLAEGDRLLFGKNDRQLGVKNGTLATVERIEGGKITVALDGKQETPERVTFDLADYQSISHGYAATVHKTQGATVDRAYVLASGGMDRHLAYVGMTRHRERADLFYAREDFKDHEAMTRRLARDGAKDTTLDYLAAAEAGKGFAASFRQAVGKAWQTIRQVFDRGDMHPAERAEREREQAQRDRAAEAERERAATRAAREKAERGKTSPLSSDRLADIFGGKTTEPASDKAREADAAARRLREELRRKRDRKPGYDREG